MHEVNVSAHDVARNGGSEVRTLVTVFEPKGSFLAAGGTIETAGQRATFGVVASYRRGSLHPLGRTELRFLSADLDFRSRTARLRHLAGPEARLTGTGILNGVGHYGFEVTLRDGHRSLDGGLDGLRLRIWNLEDGKVVYTSRDFVPLVSGSLVIRD